MFAPLLIVLASGVVAGVILERGWRGPPKPEPPPDRKRRIVNLCKDCLPAPPAVSAIKFWIDSSSGRPVKVVVYGAQRADVNEVFQALFPPGEPVETIEPSACTPIQLLHVEPPSVMFAPTSALAKIVKELEES